MKSKNKILFIIFIITNILFINMSLNVYAATPIQKMKNYSGVTVNEAYNSWTTDYKVKETNWYEDGEKITLTTTKTVPEPQIGQHHYQAIKDEVTIGYWEVKHPPAQCIHSTETLSPYGGFQIKNVDCGASYNSGWFAYCVDCEQSLGDFLVYANKNTIKNIKTAPGSAYYLFLCPYCEGLEQGLHYTHYCKAISANRYEVKYDKNPPTGISVWGYMANTKHMYNNETLYEGSSTTYTDKHLRECTYSAQGYLFNGWNTKPDGTGISYTDKASVTKLTSENNGIVTLYAQWKKTQSTLKVNANGGKYNGQSVWSSGLKNYNETYTLDSSKVTVPSGYTVTFNTNGGTTCNPIPTTKSFSGWSYSSLNGVLSSNTYTFKGGNGTTDTISIKYSNDKFELPSTTKANMSFVAWYYDAALTNFAGFAGDKISVSQNTILYAKFETLTLVAKNDYSSNSGKGAVDLSWNQADGQSKIFKVSQKLNTSSSWTLIQNANSLANNPSVNETKSSDGSFTVKLSGYYTLTAYGASGANYTSGSISKTGGKGGEVTATYWLSKGDIIYYYIGTAGSGNTGGTNSLSGYDGGAGSGYGSAGGAATVINVKRGDTTKTLLIAGGGGGANAYYDGGSGGTGGGNTTTSGVTGVGAGGGGYVGGSAGELVYHKHTDACGNHTHTAVTGATINSDGYASASGDCYRTAVDASVTCGTYREQESGWTCTTCYNEHAANCSNSSHVSCGGEQYAGAGASWTGNYCRYELHHSVSIHYVTKCDTCGSTGGSDGQSHIKPGTVYGLSCTLLEGYQCGATEDVTVDSYKQSYGGTNYVNTTDFNYKDTTTNASGKNSGKGSIKIVSSSIGFQEENKMDNVIAPDTAKPNKISTITVQQSSSGKNTKKISWSAPLDNGTIYNHKVESYKLSNAGETLLSTSNITTNTLLTGIKGYYYVINGSSTYTVTTSHNYMTSTSLTYTLTSYSNEYIHVAAIDKAGNLGPTQSKLIGSLSKPEIIEPEPNYSLKIKTNKPTISAKNEVYTTDNITYYLKADGKTEYTLNISATLNGEALNVYQIDKIKLTSEYSSSTETFEVTVPKSDITIYSESYLNDSLLTNASSDNLKFVNLTSSLATRSNYCKTLTINPTFILSSSNSDKKIKLYPSAYVYFNGRTDSSELSSDVVNSIYIIGDNTKPKITGLDKISELKNTNLSANSKTVTIGATDTISGFKSLTVTIRNNDNYMEKSFTVTDTSSMIINIMKNNYLFYGDFTVIATAVDRVGNVYTETSSTNAFTLDAALNRVRTPKDGAFKAGDGATLVLETGGYVDKVEVIFPDEMLSLNPDLNKTYIYDPAVITTYEEYNFNIPLYTPDKSYNLTVRAYKNGEVLEKQFLLTVVSGTMLDEFRTRLD